MELCIKVGWRNNPTQYTGLPRDVTEIIRFDIFIADLSLFYRCQNKLII